MSDTHQFPHFSEFTFGIEGGNSSTVLKVHWPGGVSGVTISAGYDMGSRSKAEVKAALIAAAVPEADAEALSNGAGLKGESAGDWVHDNKASLPTITRSAAMTLYEHVYYPTYPDRAKKVIAAWGGTWDSYLPRMQ